MSDLFKTAVRALKQVKRKCFLFVYPFAAPFFHKTINMSAEDAERILQTFSPRPSGGCFAENRLKKPFRYDLQIIVPAYNVEKYLRECMDSVLGQKTSYSYKVVLIDDGSTDSTPRIADEYAKDPRVTVIHQENRGISGARNTGLKEIEAEYITFLDSDDALPEGAVQYWMDAAGKYDADIVEGSYYFLSGALLTKHPCMEEREPRMCSAGNLSGFPWLKVFRSEIFQNLCFPEGFWFEDTINVFLIYPAVKKACLIPEFVYVYRDNLSGITRSAPCKPKCVDTYWVTELLAKERDRLHLPHDPEYQDMFLRQVLINAKRIKKTPKNVQKSVFCLTCGLFCRLFDAESIPAAHEPLKKALEQRDFSAYMLYVITH